MPTLKDLQTTVATDTQADLTDTEALKKATELKLTDDASVAAATIAFAAAIKGAPGGFVVDTSVAPPLLYQSTDGQTYTVTTIGSITDPVPDGPGGPSGPPADGGTGEAGGPAPTP